jgi:hypothetical protein
MKTTDVIRNVLDLIDRIDCDVESQVDTVVEPEVDNDVYDDEKRRFQQIVDFLTQSYQLYNNSPGVVVANISSVTDQAGGGWNGPKHPADIRADSVSMYPNYKE